MGIRVVSLNTVSAVLAHLSFPGILVPLFAAVGEGET